MLFGRKEFPEIAVSGPIPLWNVLLYIRGHVPFGTMPDNKLVAGPLLYRVGAARVLYSHRESGVLRSACSRSDPIAPAESGRSAIRETYC